jgi:hypothetical protein
MSKKLREITPETSALLSQIEHKYAKDGIKVRDKTIIAMAVKAFHRKVVNG